MTSDTVDEIAVSRFKNGDILFVTSSGNETDRAICDVTTSEQTYRFCHVGIIEVENNKIWVLHSSEEAGTERISLNRFKNAMLVNSAKIVHYRIKSGIDVDFSNVLQRAKDLLGKPYNFSYILSNDAYYCADFVYRCFDDFKIFNLNPMTFKTRRSDKFHPFWIAYYKKLNLQIPEGKSGCNPDMMANSDKLERIHGD